MRKSFLFLLIVTFSTFPISKDEGVLWSPVIVSSDSKEKESGSEEKTKSDSILFIGDIMLGRYVETIGIREGFDTLFAPLATLFASSTYVVGNLEGAAPKAHEKTPSGGFRFSFSHEALKALSDHRVTGVSLANNHSSDTGQEGYDDTLRKLSELSISSFGHSLFFKKEYITMRVGSTDVSVTGVNLITPEFKEKETILGIKELCEEIKDGALLIFMHAGDEYETMQSGYQVTFARKLIDETCARAIIGSHPHVVQGIEKYKDKYIFYSLGNFIFDQYFSKETMEGLILKVEESSNKLIFTLLPTSSEKSTPYLAEGTNREKILQRIAEASSPELKLSILYGIIYE
jgi:poly-gamma-glutamate synthesis protein (capsule biosynthesis protein)